MLNYEYLFAQKTTVVVSELCFFTLSFIALLAAVCVFKTLPEVMDLLNPSAFDF